MNPEVIKSKVRLQRCLGFQKQKYAKNSELKKNRQSNIYVQNNCSVAKEEKLFLNFSRNKYVRDHILFVQLMFLLKVRAAFFYGKVKRL